jgi:hypothetical protein
MMIKFGKIYTNGTCSKKKNDSIFPLTFCSDGGGTNPCSPQLVLVQKVPSFGLFISEIGQNRYSDSVSNNCHLYNIEEIQIYFLAKNNNNEKATQNEEKREFTAALNTSSLGIDLSNDFTRVFSVLNRTAEVEEGLTEISAEMKNMEEMLRKELNSVCSFLHSQWSRVISDCPKLITESTEFLNSLFLL